VGVSSRKPQQAADNQTVTVFRDGTGDFPTIDAAVDFLTRSSFVPSAKNYFVIKVGAGDFEIQNPITLPDFVSIEGEAEAATNITGTNTAAALFTVTNAFFSDIAFSNCTYVATQNAVGTIYMRGCEADGTGGKTTGGLANITINGSLLFVQRCSANFSSGSFIRVSAALAVAVENCNMIFHSGTCFDAVGGGDLSFTNNTLFNCGIGVDVGGGTQVNSRGNDFHQCTTGIIVDGVTGSFRSLNDSMLNSVNDDIVIASGNTISYVFQNTSCDPANVTYNSNVPAQNTVDTSGNTYDKLKVTTVTDNTTLSHVHTVVLVNAATDKTITLPAAATFSNWVYHIKNINTGIVTIDGNASETIDGATTQVLAVQWDHVTIVSNGTGWFTI
jgi:hypothetical protein